MDDIIELMKEHGYSLTRQNYIEFAFTSDDTNLDDLDPEQEAAIPYELLTDEPRQWEVSVKIGDNLPSVTLTQVEWSSVKAGQPLAKVGTEENQNYRFSFNGSEKHNATLCVTCEEEGEDWDSGENFIGEIEDAKVYVVFENYTVEL